MRAAPLGVVVVMLGTLLACASDTDPRAPWRQQLQADSPCYEVNLLNGLDDASTTELHLAFDCLNQDDLLAPLEPALIALDRPTRPGPPVGLALAEALGGLRDVDLDAWALLDLALRAFTDESLPRASFTHAAVELITGRPGVDASPNTLPDATALSAGPLTRAAPLLVLGAGLLRTDARVTADWAAEVLVDPATDRWLRTLDAFVQSTDPRLVPHVRGVPQHLGEALAAARDPSNDRWSIATGNSLRDLLSAVVDGPAPPIDDLAVPLVPILADARVRRNAEEAVLALQEGGHLDNVAAELAWFASVDRRGGRLDPGEVSALAAFLRLLHDTNAPLSCGTNILGLRIEVQSANLATTILQVVGGMRADDVLDVKSVLSEVLDAPLTGGMVDLIASSGLCNTITPQVVADLDAMVALGKPEAYDLVATFLEVLRALQRGQEDHLVRLVDLASMLHTRGLVPPLEEALRDVGPTDLAADLVGLLPALALPSAWGVRSEEGPPATLTHLLDLVYWLVRARDDGGDGIGWHRLAPMVLPLLDEPALWSSLQALGDVLADRRAALSTGLELVPSLRALDADGVVRPTLAALLREPRLTRPLLHAIEEGSLVAELLSPRPTGADPRPPQAFAVQLLTDGTLDDVLHMFDRLLDAMGAER